MARFSAYVVQHALVADHPDLDQQLRLAAAVERLPRHYALIYCTAPRCSWFLRRPLRMDDAHELAFNHISYAHWDALMKGHACLNPDLVDGGLDRLAERLRCVPAHLRPTLEQVAS